MLTIKNLSMLPNRKVIVDVAQSNAAPNSLSYTPYFGVQSSFMKYIGRNQETTGNIYAMLASRDDFDADKSKPKYTEAEFTGDDDFLENDGEDYDPAKHSINHTYLRRLEDIAPQYVERYVEQLAYSITKYETGGIREYNQQHPIQPTLVSSDDSEDITELADLQTFQPTQFYSNEVVVEATKQMPYVLKRLHTMSKYCGIHMVTYAAAYYRAYTKNSQGKLNKTTTATLKANRVIEEGVYLCDSEGRIKKRVEVKNKNQRAIQMFDWITGTKTAWESYRKDVNNFIRYCEILGVDLMTEDLTKYDADFYENLIVLSVTPNTQYNTIVRQALLSNVAIEEQPDEEKEVDLVHHVYMLLQDGMVTNDEIKKRVKQYVEMANDNIIKSYESILMVYNCKMNRQHVRREQLQFVDGFLTVNGQLVQMPANFLCEWYDMYTPVVFHELGYIIACLPDNMLTVLYANEAAENVKKHLGRGSDLKVEWRKFVI